MDRKQPRQRVQRPAKVSFNGVDTMPCVIRDVSIGGAGLSVSGSRWVLNGFDLGDVFSGVTRKVVVVWRDEAAMGVKFVDEGAWPKAPQRVVRTAFGRRHHGQS